LQSVVLSGALPIVALTATSGLAQTAPSITFSDLYVFGDSLSDRRNTFDATLGLIPPEPFYNDGRFSNGPIWVEQLAPQFGIPFNRRTNFAFGGATTGLTNVTVPVLPGVQAQVAGYVGSLGLTNTAADPNALYILWAGANDYLAGRQRDPRVPVNNLAQSVQTLASVGARNILVNNLPDLGQLPLSVQTRPPAELAGISALVQAHNSLLAGTLELLRPTLPQVNLFQFDVASLFQTAIANPAQFGFTNVTDSCLNPSPLTLTPETIFTTPVVPCSSPNTTLFWDGFHPTTAGHGIIATSAFESINAQAVPEPSAAVGLLTAGGLLYGTTALKRRRQRSAAKAFATVVAQEPSRQPLRDE
jgi:phospholipase/lecithinase/hemolysin